MQLARLRQRTSGVYEIELEQEFLFAATILVHIERLNGVRVISKQAWFMADQFHAVFLYESRRFELVLNYGRFRILCIDGAPSPDLFDQLVDHMNAYRTVWPHQLAFAALRYFFLPSGR
jgi:hypothetical protein